MSGPTRRHRRVGSVRSELLVKSREAALAAVQIFNSPLITFRAEIFIVLMVIAWTYLLHAHYRKLGIEYRYYEKTGDRRRFSRTRSGAFRYWELERCLNCVESPIDKDSASNLRFLIGIRHEIEHQMTTRIDDELSAKFQACCINYNDYLIQLFGDTHGIDKHLSISLQLSSMRKEQVDLLRELDALPSHIRRFIDHFEGQLSDEEYNSSRFGYRVLFVKKTTNSRKQADEVIEFADAGSPLAENVNKTYALIKETERPKLLPSEVVSLIKSEGFPGFTIQRHTELWKESDAKNPARGFGTKVAKTWYWYESWCEHVRRHCRENRDRYG
jgi:hypothetical protein